VLYEFPKSNRVKVAGKSSIMCGSSHWSMR
jgi:hypothetical protein